MSELVAQGLTVRRGGRAILDQASLACAGGDFVAVIGPNGAGKSTLLSVLAGLLKPDDGGVSLDGRPIGDYPRADLARRRAYLPQNPRCEWPISVERLVALGLTPSLPAFGGLPAAMAGRIDQVLQDCDLAARRDQAATTLSGGELARAMLARALVGEPRVLIVDEPIAGLDPRHALDSARRLAALARQGVLVVASVHDLTTAARFSTRILALRAGRVVADGPTAQTLTAPRLGEVFDVDARVSGVGEEALVDVRGASVS